MFYLFLVIFSLAEVYFLNSIKTFIFQGNIIPGDFFFSLICLGLAFFMVLGSLHIKHLNNEGLKKLGFGIIALGGLTISGSILSFNTEIIFSGLEYGIILIIFGYFVYYYQTVPEGEPDAEIDESELNELDNNESFYFKSDNYFANENYSDSFGMDYYGENQGYEDNITQPEIAQLKETLNNILEIEDLDIDLNNKVKSILDNVNKVDEANSEYKLENINNLQIIFNTLLDSIINSEDANDTIELINQSFEMINKNLENIYYNTRGAQVFRVERDVNELASKLTN